MKIGAIIFAAIWLLAGVKTFIDHNYVGMGICLFFFIMVVIGYKQMKK